MTRRRPAKGPAPRPTPLPCLRPRGILIASSVHHPDTEAKPAAGQPRLAFIPDEVEWPIDEHTREVGRRGVAEARAALRACRTSDRATNAPETAERPSRSGRAA